MRWYNGRKATLGTELVQLASKYRKELALNPDRWAVFPDWVGEPVVRSRHLSKFPYRIVYYADDKHLNVIAYAHESRIPGYWQSRVSFWDANPVKTITK
jgi:hypothetical protein